MKKSVLIIAILAVVVLVFGFFYFSGRDISPKYNETAIIGNGSPEESMIVFDIPKKSAHYESNTPEHGAVLAGVPVNVVIDFNFDLAQPSAISVVYDKTGEEFGTGGTIIDANKLAMRRDKKQEAPDGLYNVDYKACW